MMEQYLRGLGGVVFLRQFDLFSQPYVHRVDYNQKTKKTAFGGVISLLIILLSLAYLIYILYLFFGGKYTPTVTLIQTTQEGLVDHTIDFSPFAFTFREGGKVFDKWQTYFDVIMYLDNDGSSPTTNPFQIKKCKDVLPEFTNLQDHYCIDTSTPPTITLQTNQADPGTDVLFNFALFSKTDCSIPANCDPSQSVLKQSNFLLEFAFIYDRYDTDKQKTVKMMQRENIVVDNQLFVQDIYQVQLTEASVDDGFLLASITNTGYISDFRKTSSILTEATKNKRYSSLKNSQSLLRIAQIQLTDSLVNLTIQYPKISIVLAQFQSIFSTLLIVGIVAKLGSENKHVEESIEIIMNNYYKQSAIDIDNFLESKKDPKKQSKKQKNLQTIEPTTDQPKQVKNNSKLKNRLFSLYSLKMLKHYYTDGKKIKDEEVDIQLKGFKKALSKSWHLMNAHQMHLEILRTKTALQLLLSEKQYAALDFVSRRLYPKQGEENHLENLDRIDEDEDYRIQKAIEYYDELMKKEVTDPVDQKIKSSIIKSIFEEKLNPQTDEEKAYVFNQQKGENYQPVNPLVDNVQNPMVDNNQNPTFDFQKNNQPYGLQTEKNEQELEAFNAKQN